MPLKPVDINAQNFDFSDEAPSTGIAPAQPQQQQAQQQPESTEPGVLTKAGQFAKGLGVRALQAPFKLVELPFRGIEWLSKQIATEPEGGFKESKYPSDYIEEQFDPASIEPENLFSRALQYTAGNWPAIFLMPGSLLAKVGSDLAASTGVSIAEEAGLGPIAKIGAAVLGSKGFDKAAGLLKQTAKQPGKIAQFTSDLYKKEAELGSKIPVDSRNILKKFDSLERKVRKELVSAKGLNTTQKQEVVDNISALYDQVDKRNLNASELFDIKKSLNKIYVPPKTTQGKLYQELRGIVRDELDDVAKTHKTWGDSFKKADELVSIGHWQTGLGQWLDGIVDSHKAAKVLTSVAANSALAILLGSKIGIKSGIASLAPVAAYGGLKGYESAARGTLFLNSLRKTPEGSKLLWDIVADSAKNNTKAITKDMVKLNSFAKKFDTENPQQQTQKLNPVGVDPNAFEFAD